MDAGPGLNFFSVNQERLLFHTLGALCTPETVQTELLRKARQDNRFAPAEKVWKKLPERLMTVLSDDMTEPLAHAVQRITGIPFDRRVRSSQDLGEIMVVAHASVSASAGHKSIILMDDQYGRYLATQEARRLLRLRKQGCQVGSMHLVYTPIVLRRAAGSTYLPDRDAMRRLYRRLRELDDGLLPLEATDLMDLSCWDH